MTEVYNIEKQVQVVLSHLKDDLEKCATKEEAIQLALDRVSYRLWASELWGVFVNQFTRKYGGELCGFQKYMPETVDAVLKAIKLDSERPPLEFTSDQLEVDDIVETVKLTEHMDTIIQVHSTTLGCVIFCKKDDRWDLSRLTLSYSAVNELFRQGSIISVRRGDNVLYYRGRK